MFLKRDWLFSVQVSAGLRAGGTPVWAETKPSSVTALYFSAPLPRIPQGGFGGNGRKLKTGHRRTESSRLTAAGARTAFTDRQQYLNGSAIISLNSRIRPAQTALQETLGGKQLPRLLSQCREAWMYTQTDLSAHPKQEAAGGGK